MLNIYYRPDLDWKYRRDSQTALKAFFHLKKKKKKSVEIHSCGPSAASLRVQKHLRLLLLKDTSGLSLRNCVWLDKTAAPDSSALCVGSQSVPICFHCCWARTSTGKVGNGTGPVRQSALLSCGVGTREQECCLCKSFDLAEMDLLMRQFQVYSSAGSWKTGVNLNMWCCKVLLRRIGGLTARMVSIKPMNFSGYYA